MAFDEKAYRKSYYLIHKNDIRERVKKWRLNNPEKYFQYNKDYWKKVKDTQKLQKKIWREKNREKIRKYQREWREKHRERLKELNKKYKLRTRNVRLQKDRERRKNDPIFYIKCQLYSRLHKILNSKTKKAKTLELVGCSLEQLKFHLESQFKKGMNWNNKGEWHIDHIRPLSKFNLLNGIEQKQAFNWKNLQPLWAEENLKKYNKIIK